MVSVCLPSDALLQHLSSYLGFSYLGHGISLHGCSSKVQLLLLTLDERYLLTADLPDLQHGVAPLGPPAPTQPQFLGCGVGPPGHRPWPQAAAEVHLVSSVQFSSVTQSCPTLCNPMNRSTPGLPVHHQLPEFTQTHVHLVSDAIQSSHPLSSPSPPDPNPSQHQSLFQ